MRFWKASVHEKRHLLDPIKRAKNQVARLINYNLQKLSAVTRKASLAFPALSRMHAFERVPPHDRCTQVHYVMGRSSDIGSRSVDTRRG